MKSYAVKSCLALLVIFSLFNCSEDDGVIEPLCLAPPAGTVEPSQINITIYAALLSEGVSDVHLEIDGSEVAIDTEPEFSFSRWATIPSGNVTSIRFTLDNSTYETAVTGTSFSNTLVLELSESNGQYFANLSEYVECNDTPST